MARREFNRKTRTEAIKRADGKCQKCSAVLKSGEAEVDHILEDQFGGEPTLANAQVLCKPCHKVKTAERVRMMRKADRQGDKASGAVRPKGAFSKAPKPPKPEKFDLTVRRPMFVKETTP